MTRTVHRNIVNNVMLTLTGVCTVLTVSILFLILGFLVWNGWQSLDWNFFVKLPLPAGETGGGMGNAIIGSGITILIAVCIGIGIFAWTVVVVPTHRFSAWAGGFALSLMMIPIGLRSTEQFLRSIPGSLREGSLALGASKTRTILSVIVPAAKQGILTGMILGVARVAGETAPLLFTSLNNQFWSDKLSEPTATLPVMIYTHAISPYEDWHRQAWAAGLVLLTLVLVANIAARLILSRGASSQKA